MPPRLCRRDVSSVDWVRALAGLKRGDVLKISLRGSEGQELAGPHYAVVFSIAEWNTDQTLVIVPAGSHGGKPVPRAYEVALVAGDGDLDKDGVAIPRQIRTIGKSRIEEIYGTLSENTMDEIADHVAWGLGLVEADE